MKRALIAFSALAVFFIASSQCPGEVLAQSDQTTQQGTTHQGSGNQGQGHPGGHSGDHSTGQQGHGQQGQDQQGGQQGTQPTAPQTGQKQ